LVATKGLKKEDEKMEEEAYVHEKTEISEEQKKK